MLTEIQEKVSKSLGSENSYAVYSDKPQPELLNPIPRELARQEHSIIAESFIGMDIWHCHEATFLLNNGYPVAGTLKISIPCTSKDIVESKSFKLYLNSYDMSKMGENVKSAVRNYEESVLVDLTGVLKTPGIYVKFYSEEEFNNSDKQLAEAFAKANGSYNFLNPKSTSEEITDYSGKLQHLVFEEGQKNKAYTYRLYTNVLRSRCRHTKQKDTGTAFIFIRLKEGVSLETDSVLRQIISIRELNEFHEFCAEKLFTDIMKTGNVRHCCVQLLYARRGSLDINPVRTNFPQEIFSNLIDVNQVTYKQLGQ